MGVVGDLRIAAGQFKGEGELIKVDEDHLQIMSEKHADSTEMVGNGCEWRHSEP